MGLTCTLTGTIYRDDGAVATGAVVSFTLCAPRNTHWTSNNRVVLRAVLSATTDGSGNFSQVVARNDELTPAGTYWKVECADAALLKHIAANADTLNVIDAPDLDASAQVFSGLDDPDADWVAHGHAQTLTAAKKLQAATNLGLNLSASQLLGQASSGGTGLPVAVTLGTGLAMSGTTLNATSSVSDGDKGDITVSNTGATWTIDNDAITLAKLAHMPTARVVGRTTAGTGTPELLTISGTGSVAMTTSPTFTTPALGTPASGDFSTGAFAWPTFDQNTTGSAGSAATLTTTRTIGGANFNGSEDVTSFPSPGAIGGTTPNTIAGTTGTFSGDLITTGTSAQIYTSGAAAYLATYGAAAHIYTDGANAQIYTSGTFASISTGGSSAHISTGGSGAYIQTRSTFRLNGGTYVTTLSHAATANRAIALPDDSGTLALTTDITGGTLAGSFTTLTASATTSLLLGTAGSAVGNIGFRNATSGTTTLAPATGALGTGTVTLPLSGTLATLQGSNTYTGTTNTFTLPTTTGTTTASGIAVAGNSLTTGTGIYAASSSLTSGKLLDLQVSGTAAAASQTVLNVATAGANGTSGITTKGTVISNTHTGTTSTNVALELTASGGTTNTALNVTAGAIVLQQSPTKYTTITPGAVGGLVFTLTTDGSSLDANYGITVPGNLTIAGSNGYGSAISATGRIQTSGAVGGGSIGWYNNGNVGFSFSGTTVSTGSSTTVLSVGATTESTTTTTGAIVTAGGLGVVKNVNIGGTLAVTGASTLTGLLTANGGITLGDGQNIAFNTTTGTKIGAATTQKLSFWNATPIVQPTTAVASATVAHTGGGTNIKTDDTFDGYTIAQVVKALRNAGLLA